MHGKERCPSRTRWSRPRCVACIVMKNQRSDSNDRHTNDNKTWDSTGGQSVRDFECKSDSLFPVGHWMTIVAGRNHDCRIPAAHIACLQRVCAQSAVCVIQTLLCSDQTGTLSTCCRLTRIASSHIKMDDDKSELLQQFCAITGTARSTAVDGQTTQVALLSLHAYLQQ